MNDRVRRALLLVLFALAACEASPSPERVRANEAYDRYRRPDLVIGALHLRGGERVLEVGAGEGYLTIPLAKTGAKITAIDIDEKALAKLDAQKLANVETRVVRPDDPELEANEMFDLVLLGEVDHLLPDRVQYFAKLKPHTKKLAVTNRKSFERPLIEAAENTGFKRESTFDQLPGHFLIIFGATP